MNILAKANMLAGSGGVVSVPVAERAAFIDQVKAALPTVSKAEVREALLSAWSGALETQGRDAAKSTNLAQRVWNVLTGHTPLQRNDGTFSPRGAQIAQLANKTSTTATTTTPAAQHESLLRQHRLIEGTAKAVERLGSLEAVEKFKKLSPDEQDKVLLAIDPSLDMGGHSGASYSYAVSLGKALLGDRASLSAALHNDLWLKGYIAANTEAAGVKPRVKPTAWKPESDGTWTNDPQGGHTVNIAQSFDKLPPDWQAENLAAAMAVRDIMRSFPLSDSPGSIEQASSQVHERWLGRPNNAYAKGSELDVPYAKLSVEEKIKDVNQVLAWAVQTAPDKVADIEKYIADLRAAG